VAGARERLLGHLGDARAQPCTPRRVLGLVGEREEPIGVEEIGVVADDDALTLPVHPDLPDSRPVSKQFLDRPCDVFDALGRIDPDAGSAPDRVGDTKADGFFRVQHRTVLRYDPLLPEAPAVLKGRAERTPVASASAATPLPAAGSRTRTVVPRPSVLSIPSAPSCACTMCLTITGTRSTAARRSGVRPSSRSDSVSRSSIRRPRRSAWRSITDRKRRAVGRSSPGGPSSVSAYPLIAVSGVRSSCETLATKSRRTTSRRRSSVTSCRTRTKPKGRPSASRSGAAFTWSVCPPASVRSREARGAPLA